MMATIVYDVPLTFAEIVRLRRIIDALLGGDEVHIRGNNRVALARIERCLTLALPSERKHGRYIKVRGGIPSRFI